MPTELLDLPDHVLLVILSKLRAWQVARSVRGLCRRMRTLANALTKKVKVGGSARFMPAQMLACVSVHAQASFGA